VLSSTQKCILQRRQTDPPFESSRYPIASRKLSLHISDHIDKKKHLFCALFLYILAEINYKTHSPSGFKMEESKNVSNVSILSEAEEGHSCNKNIDIKATSNDVFLDNLHQLRSISKHWKHF
jgi:hypothetical protein